MNLVQRWQEFDESVLFYTSVLGLDASVAVEVAGPTGLVRSQVMRTADGSIRVPLNVAPPVLEGSGLPQHVAFSTDRIVDIAREALKRGLEFLTVPDNYYDDLVARFDLAPQTVAQLRELGLLYDREAGRRVRALLHRHGGRGVLRGGPAERRLRRIWGRQRAGPAGCSTARRRDRSLRLRAVTTGGEGGTTGGYCATTGRQSIRRRKSTVRSRASAATSGAPRHMWSDPE